MNTPSGGGGDFMNIPFYGRGGGGGFMNTPSLGGGGGGGFMNTPSLGAEALHEHSFLGREGGTS